MEIKGILFDYGGTLDANGKHWAAIIWDLYQKKGVDIDQTIYESAYVYAERKMATSRLVHPAFNFQQVLEVKLLAQFDFLENQGIFIDRKLATAIALEGYLLAGEHVEEAKGLLKELHRDVPMVMVSNFYGNLQTVLQDFAIDHYFDAIVESSVVGVRKPDPAIFQLGIDALGLPANQCVAIGDSYVKDIVPAKACGCQTVWLKGEGWIDDQKVTDSTAADYIISDMKELIAILKVLPA